MSGKYMEPKCNSSVFVGDGMQMTVSFGMTVFFNIAIWLQFVVGSACIALSCARSFPGTSDLKLFD